MEKKEITHTLEKKFAEHLLTILRHEGCLDDTGDDVVLERIEVDFEDGVIVEIDVCNGSREDNSSPYLNVNWYKDNKCLYAFDTDPEGELFGTYDFVLDEDENEINYILNLVIGEKEQKLETSLFTFEGLIEHIEFNFSDESIQSNYWENKYDLKSLVELLGESLIFIDNVAYASLQDGLYAIHYDNEESICTQYTIQLFEVDDIVEVSADSLLEKVESLQAEVKKIQNLLNHFVK